MRQLTIHVSRGKGEKIVEIAQEFQATSAVWTQSVSVEGEIDTVSVVIQNRTVGALLDEISKIGVISSTLQPQEVIVFRPPANELPEIVRNLEARSPLEIYLLSIQSFGSWGGFLAYAAAGAILTWIGFFTNSVYLVIAAMLIAPFAGPAMNVALATATGDDRLFQKAIIRYFAAILVTTIVGGALGLLFNQEVVTDLMEGVGHVSAAAVLLPLVAGAAGAFNLVQSDRTSLVSGTAVGTLVTASLAPPAALVGVAGVMSEWNLVLNAIFQLILQLVGINLAGALIFRQQGLNPSLGRYRKGKRWLTLASVGVATLVLGALLGLQFTRSLRLERSSASTRAAKMIRDTVTGIEHIHLINVDTQFQVSEPENNNTLLATVYVEPARDRAEDSYEELSKQLQRTLQNRLQTENPQMVPLVSVIVLAPPPYTPAPPERNNNDQ